MSSQNRMLLNGNLVKVIEAKKSRTFTLTKEALSNAECAPNKCAIANQGAITTHNYWEVYPTVAYEVYAPGKARRYNMSAAAQKILIVNDLASPRLSALEGFEVKLTRPSPCRTREYFRSAMRKTRDKRANIASLNRKPEEKRAYTTPLARRLALRAPATCSNTLSA